MAVSTALAFRRGELPPASPPRVWMESLERRYLLSTIGITSPNDLDPTFGHGGAVTIPLPTIDNREAGIDCLATAADGKIYALVDGPSPDISQGASFILMRFNADGSADTTFGRGGQVTVDTGFDVSVYVPRLIFQPDGKLLIPVGGHDEQVSFWRFNPDGTPDNGFGTDGRADVATGANSADLDPTAPVYLFVGLRADGKIVTLFDKSLDEIDAPSTSNDPIFLSRLNADGTPDLSLGRGGTRILNVPTDSNPDSDFTDLSGVQLMPDGRFVGYIEVDHYPPDAFNSSVLGDPTSIDVEQFRLDANGAFLRRRNVYHTTMPTIVPTEQPDGSLLVQDGALQRIGLDGAVDHTFVAPPDSLNGVQLWPEFEPDGTTLLVGYPVEDNRVTLERLDADGSVDTTFPAGDAIIGFSRYNDWSVVPPASDGTTLIGAVTYADDSSTVFVLGKIVAGSRVDPSNLMNPVNVDTGGATTTNPVTDGGGSAAATGTPPPNDGSDPNGASGTADRKLPGTAAPLPTSVAFDSSVVLPTTTGYFAAAPGSTLFNPDGTGRVFDGSGGNGD